MKVETRELPDSELELTFEVEDARVERAMDAAYRRVASQVNIAGFRRGKAPRSLVERVVGRESLMEEALNHLLPEVFEEAVRDSQIRALTEPQFDVEGLSPLRAKATVVVEPPVTLGDYESIHRHEEPVSVPPEDVDAVLQQFREAHAEWVPVERAAALEDRIAIDVKGVAEERTIVDQEDVEYVMRPGSTTPMPGFAEQLVGISAGETRSFTLTMPTDDDDAELSGKDVVFEVSAKDVKAKELPELDDDFASTVSSFGTLEELRTQVEASLKEQAEHRARHELEDQVLDEAVTSSTIELPEKLIVHHAERSKERLARDLDTRGLTVEQYLRITQTSEKDLEDRLRTEAERTLRRGLVLQAIARREGVVVSDDAVDAEIRQALTADGGNARAIARAQRQSEIRDRVRTALIEQEAAKWLVEHALGSTHEHAEPEEPENPVASSEEKS